MAANQTRPGWSDSPWRPFHLHNRLTFSNRSVSAEIFIDCFRLNNPQLELDHYLFMVLFRHKVLDYKENIFTVGFYGEYMGININCLTPGNKLYEWGPNNTIEKNEAKFSLGNGLKGLYNQVLIDVSFDTTCFTNRVNIVTTAHVMGQESLNWYFTLPKVEWFRPNPYPEARFYESLMGFVLQVPKGKWPELNIQPDVKWALHQPRGTVFSTYSWNTPERIKFSGNVPIE